MDNRNGSFGMILILKHTMNTEDHCRVGGFIITSCFPCIFLSATIQQIKIIQQPPDSGPLLQEADREHYSS